ncbi:MAG: nucleotidyltransferase family protein [Chloroflexota bacterium]|nr:nucleotidyltransferase family protein [Dehalococcoidia bacterium]MDW8252721.1 nucleotidyltransferase family protein [Chloroflexota bacterium]
MPLPVAILAGGLATRLRPITERIPKVLIDVAGRPFAERQIALLRQNGYTRLVYLLGYLGEQVVAQLGDGSRYGVAIDYVFDGPQLRGTGGAIKAALPVLGERFFTLYGDSYLDIDYAAVERAFLASGKPALMTVFRNAGRWDRSNVVFRDGRVVCYDKRAPTPEMEYLDYGLNAFEARVFDRYPADQPFDLADVQHDLAARGELAGYEVTTRFYEVGSPAGLEEAVRYFEALDRLSGQTPRSSG